MDPTQALIAARLPLTGAQDEDPRQGSLELCRIVEEVVAVGAVTAFQLALADTRGQ
jgi:hypothetical protein